MIKSLLESITHPSEMKAMIQLIWNGQLVDSNSSQPNWTQENDARRFSYNALNRVSRSFAAVIQQLPPDLEDAICVFYLVLRGLDSVEDDMNLRLDEKQRKLVMFHLRLNSETDYVGIGDTPDYRSLMANFHKVGEFYGQLSSAYQAVIKDICQRMGEGMTEFTVRKVESIEDYDDYCHYVAGLVGWGLSKLFAVSGYEEKELEKHLDLANSMGLFLQKTNITRDYHEDMEEGRLFWPSAIWGKHASDISEFSQRPTDSNSVAALNEMVTDALRHLPDCVRYMSMLHCREVFRFCAIPQAMAIATLAKVYGNPEVFVRNVKIRKGLTAKIMMEVVDADSLWDIMEQQLSVLEDKIRSSRADGQQAFKYIQEARMEMALSRSRSREMGHYRKVS